MRLLDFGFAVAAMQLDSILGLITLTAESLKMPASTLQNVTVPENVI